MGGLLAVDELLDEELLDEELLPDVPVVLTELLLDTLEPPPVPVALPEGLDELPLPQGVSARHDSTSAQDGLLVTHPDEPPENHDHGA